MYLVCILEVELIGLMMNWMCGSRKKTRIEHAFLLETLLLAFMTRHCSDSPTFLDASSFVSLQVVLCPCLSVYAFVLGGHLLSHVSDYSLHVSIVTPKSVFLPLNLSPRVPIESLHLGIPSAPSAFHGLFAFGNQWSDWCSLFPSCLGDMFIGFKDGFYTDFNDGTFAFLRKLLSTPGQHFPSAPWPPHKLKREGWAFLLPVHPLLPPVPWLAAFYPDSHISIYLCTQSFIQHISGRV